MWSPLSATQAAASASPTTVLSSTTSVGLVPCPHTCGHAGLSAPDGSIPRAISESRLPSPQCGRQSTKLLILAVTCHCSYRNHFRSIENSLTMNLKAGEVSPGGTTSGSSRIGQAGHSPWCRTSSSAMAVSCSARRRGFSSRQPSAIEPVCKCGHRMTQHVAYQRKRLAAIMTVYRHCEECWCLWFRRSDKQSEANETTSSAIALNAATTLHDSRIIEESVNDEIA